MKGFDSASILAHSSHFNDEVFTAIFNLYGELRGTRHENYMFNELLNELKPVLAYVLNTWYSHNDSDLQDDMIQRSIVDFSRWVSKMDPNESWIGCFSSIVQRVKWRCMDAVNDLDHNTVFDLDYNNRSLHDFIGVPESHNDVLNRIYCDELKDEILFKVKNWIRFEDRRQQACVYIASRMIDGKKIIDEKLRRFYRLKNLRFYKDYVIILIRNALYKIKDSVGNYFESTWIQNLYVIE